MMLWIEVYTCGEKCDFNFRAGTEISYHSIATDDTKVRWLDIPQIDDDKIDDTDTLNTYYNSVHYDDIVNPESLDWTEIRDCNRETLAESFWEAMNGDNPDELIVDLLKAEPEYDSLKTMTEQQLRDFVYDFVAKTLITTQMTYELDGVDITDKVGSQTGEWDDFVFSEITYYAVYQLCEMFKE